MTSTMKYWRSFLRLHELLGITEAQARQLLNNTGEHDVNGFLVKVERGMSEEKNVLPLVSVWARERCVFKGMIRPEL